MDNVLYRSVRAISLVMIVAFISASGCNWPSADQKADQKASSQASRNSLSILIWDEYVSEDLVSAFVRETETDVEFTYFKSLNEMEELLRSRPSGFDLALTSNMKVPDLVGTGLIRPLDKSLLPMLENMDDMALGAEEGGDDRYSVPYMFGTTLIAYRSDKIAEPTRNWSALWDERYRGRVLLLDEPFDTYAAALMTLGYDINTQDRKQLTAASDLLTEHVTKLESRMVDIFEVREKLLSGDCWIAMTYSSDAAVISEEDSNISYFVPDEGAPLWLDSFVIPREAKNLGAAHSFLDFLCRPDVAAANSSELWCATANRVARSLVSKEVLEDSTIYLPEHVLKKCQFERRSGPEREMLVNQGFKRIFDEIRQAEASKQRAVAMPAESIAEP